MEYLHIDDELHLEKAKKSHIVPILEIIQREREYLRQWLPFVDQTRHPGDTKNYFRILFSSAYSEHNTVYIVWYRGEIAGLASYKDIDRVNHKCEIGYWLTEKMQGKGIMTRTVKKMVEFGFRNMRMNRIQIKVAVGNIKSAAIPGRLGFTFEGTERSGECHTDRYLDLEIFSMLKPEWIRTIIKE